MQIWRAKEDQTVADGRYHRGMDEDKQVAPEPFSVTAYSRGPEWWVRIEDDCGGIIDDHVTLWDGRGRFYDEGLNSLVSQIPQGYVYTSWAELPDGSYVASLYPLDPRFGI